MNGKEFTLFPKEGVTPDVRILCADGQLSVHGFLLRTASQRLREIVLHSTIVDMTKFTTEVMEIVINFIYITRFQIREDNIADVITAARLWQLDELADYLEDSYPEWTTEKHAP